MLSMSTNYKFVVCSALLLYYCVVIHRVKKNESRALGHQSKSLSFV